MDKLGAMQAFVAVVKQGGFAAGARSLGVTASSVTRKVRALEESIGAKLLDRTTRSVQLTEIGRGYLDRCLHIFDEIERADEEAALLRNVPRGTLRLAAPHTFTEHVLAPIIMAYLDRYPDVCVDVITTELAVDPYDVAIVRSLESLDDALVAKPLVRGEGLFVAAPVYLARRGRPETLADLVEHDVITGHVPLPDGRALPGRARFIADDDAIRRRAAVAGQGITFLPDFLIGDDLRAGRLESLFDQERSIVGKLFAVYPQPHMLAAKTRAFVDLLLAAFGPVEE